MGAVVLGALVGWVWVARAAGFGLLGGVEIVVLTRRKSRVGLTRADASVLSSLPGARVLGGGDGANVD